MTTEENGKKKKSPWVIAATVLGAVGTVITAVAALLSAMDVEKVLDKSTDKNDLMLESLFNYSTAEISDIKAAVARIEGEVSVLRDVCMQPHRPECEQDDNCPDGHMCVDGQCVGFGHRRPVRDKPDPPMPPPPDDEDEGGAVMGSGGGGVGSSGSMGSVESMLEDMPSPKRREDAFRAIQQKAEMGEAWDGDWKALEDAPLGE